ncbi:MAG: hypothetical protein R3B57_12240 [Phycisphaerales bacterium]
MQTLFDLDASQTPDRPAPGRLNRDQVIDHILSINPSAGRRFLEQFESRRLDDYLDRLVATGSPRGREARWVRSGDTPAIEVRRRRG